jgi:RNA polymerase-binding transcription factor DksA
VRESDDLDVAAELQEAFNLKGIQASREALLQRANPDFDGKHCVECAEKIPKERLDWGRMSCTLCQDSIEKKNRIYR